MILFAEYSFDDAFLLKRAFRRLDAPIRIEHVKDGDEVIAFLGGLQISKSAASELPRLLLLDIQMPGSNGFDVLRWRQENSFWLRLPTIIFSSSAEERDVVKAYELGANSYAVKPCTLEGYTKFAEAVSVWWMDQNFAPGTEAKRPFTLARGY